METIFSLRNIFSYLLLHLTASELSIFSPNFRSSAPTSILDRKSNSFNGPKANHCLVLSVHQLVSALVEFCSTWLCQGCYMDFSKLLHGFVNVDTSGYMDLSNWLNGIV